MISKAVEDATREVEQSVLRLTAVLLEAREGIEGPEVNHQVLVLVREAYDLLTNPETAIDLKDWVKAAERFVRS